MPTAEARLAGVRVLVTRPASQADELLRLVRRAGGEAIPFPTLAIEPMAPPDSQVEQLAGSDTLIFTSSNAVRCGYPILRRLDETNRRTFAIGAATKRALEDLGCREVHSTAGARSSSEELLAHPLLRDVAGRRVCIVRGQGGREALREALAARGARAAYLECYRRLPGDPDVDRLTRALEPDPESLVISVTSVEGLSNLLDLVPNEFADRLRSRPLFVVGSRQEQAARRNAWNGQIFESPASDEGIVETIAAWRDQN